MIFPYFQGFPSDMFGDLLGGFFGGGGGGPFGGMGGFPGMGGGRRGHRKRRGEDNLHPLKFVYHLFIVRFLVWLDFLVITLHLSSYHGCLLCLALGLPYLLFEYNY